MVFGSECKDIATLRKWYCQGQSDNIEMTAVVGDQNKRQLRRNIFLTYNLKPVPQFEKGANTQPPHVANGVSKDTCLALDTLVAV